MHGSHDGHTFLEETFSTSSREAVAVCSSAVEQFDDVPVIVLTLGESLVREFLPMSVPSVSIMLNRPEVVVV